MKRAPVARTASAAGDATATQRIYDAVHAAILEHRIAPGTRLREADLAESFDVSRTVVRQALNRLSQDRVVELQHNRGAAVSQPARAEAAHVFDARRVIEGEITRRLAGKLDVAAIERLQAVVQAEARAEARGDRPTTIRQSGEFHRELARLSGNPVFVSMLDELLPRSSLLLALYQQPGRPACVAHRHQELLAALREGSAARAATEMRKHLSEIERSIAVPSGAAASSLRDLFANYRAA